jgi:5-methylcytosine-specific restriction enzyme subunit McrC
MTAPLILREGAPARLIDLAAPIADALNETQIARCVRTAEPGVWEVTAGTHIGVVNVAGMQLIIQPKIAINRLIFLMGYARYPRFWRDDAIDLDPDDDLSQALTRVFIRLATKALDQGLLKGYCEVETHLPVLRGRIREADQLRQHWGRNIPLEVRYDEFTVNIPENQILLAAVVRLLKMPAAGRGQRAGLQRLRLQLTGVTLPSTISEWTPSRLNVRYQPALEIAELILAGRSFEQRVGEVTVTGYLFSMAQIFEDFVTVALGEALTPYGGRASFQYPIHLDNEEQVDIRPDFVWLEGYRTVIVADAKYKAEKPAGFPNADLYQLLAYCTVLGLPVGHLIYAKGNEEPRQYTVQRAGTRLVAHTLDLSLPPCGASGVHRRPRADPLGEVWVAAGVNLIPGSWFCCTKLWL